MAVHDYSINSAFPENFQDQFPGTITPRRVKIALDALLHGRLTPPSDSLEQLILVDQVLTEAIFPVYAYKRIVALGVVLTSLITKELVIHRRAMGIRSLMSKTSMKAALKAIRRDSQCFNQELLGWSWLYYRYVRVELNIRPQVFWQTCSITERTLRRYQEHGIRRLTQHLIAEELQAQMLSSKVQVP